MIISREALFIGRLFDLHSANIDFHNNDQSFPRNYFNKIVADRMNMFMYEERTDFGTGETVQVVKEAGWKDNSGLPYIEVMDGDYGRSKELYLRHKFDGQTLDPKYIEKTLPCIYKLWQRPVHLETYDDELEETLVYTFDGTKVTCVGDDDDDEDGSYAHNVLGY